MKIFYSYDQTTNLYIEDIHIEAESIKPLHDGSMPKSTAQFYTQPANSTDIQPVGFHTPRWSGNGWVEAGDHVVIAALKKEVAFSTSNKKTLEKIAALEVQQTLRLLRGVALSDVYSVNKLKSLESQIIALRKTLV